ncbi:hypothetical protein PPMP20_02365 [Paraburkholderia phymatum]|uniref:YtkA-like domain-containing protein n=1 Tax=Paraburkholderia phymatum (strain DSM 17167 / CIP 108236 / LMG 21445 / STM815) TaxID=391038 RepID=B2JWG1_PARP8|nr:hypothetical protein [Paraburkholderia phymatum]ACC75288.1 conserved hypothetical protein [Paraburkholderia phymatum STM815]
MRIRLQLIGAIFTTFLLGVCTVIYADDLSRTVTAHGLTVHYGIVPTSKPGESGSTAASDVPSPGPNQYHLTVAIFDSATGKRVSDATVVASVKGPRSYDTHFHAKPVEKRLDAVTVGSAVTYGNDFLMPWSGIYHVDLTVTQKDQPKPTKIRLNYDHRF